MFFVIVNQVDTNTASVRSVGVRSAVLVKT